VYILPIINERYPNSRITGSVIGAAMEVHRRLGPGFLESVYEEALAIELSLKKISYERQKQLPVIYRGKVIKDFICDFFIENQVIVELKAIKQLNEIEKIQVISYLKASEIELGLLINFGSRSLEYKRLIQSTKPNNQ
jgi:GxxExxY protein